MSNQIPEFLQRNHGSPDELSSLEELQIGSDRRTAIGLLSKGQQPKRWEFDHG